MESTVSTSRRFRAGSTTAASSPIPTMSQDGAGGSLLLMRATSSRSDRSETVILRRVPCVASAA
ncbi:MAG: hypothetical protein DMF90_18665 [Acidobacteria bacterium]|nr:MAG: hypothetical protein DMF90_18665 [Acidobacteriota bacterium]